jgi:hypothetical protein
LPKWFGDRPLAADGVLASTAFWRRAVLELWREVVKLLFLRNLLLGWVLGVIAGCVLHMTGVW